MVSVGLTLALPIFTKKLVDSAMEAHLKGITYTAAALVMVLLLSIGLRFVESRLYTRIQLRMTHHMRSDFMDALFHKKYGDLKGYHSGQLVNHLFNDVQSVVSGVMDVIPVLLHAFLQLCGAVFLVARLDLVFVMVLVAAGVFALLIMLLFHEKNKNFQKKVREADDAMHATAQESIENIRMIKAAGIEERKVRELLSVQDNHLKHSVEKNDFSTLLNMGLDLVIPLTPCLFCFFGGAGYRATFKS